MVEGTCDNMDDVKALSRIENPDTKVVYSMHPLTGHSRKVKIIGIESRAVVPKGYDGGE